MLFRNFHTCEHILDLGSFGFGVFDVLPKDNVNLGILGVAAGSIVL